MKLSFTVVASYETIYRTESESCGQQWPYLYLPPATKLLRQGNVFTPVCQSFFSQGGVHARGDMCAQEVHGKGV